MKEEDEPDAKDSAHVGEVLLELEDAPDLCRRLNGPRPFAAHVIDGVAGFDAQRMNQIARHQDSRPT